MKNRCFGIFLVLLAIFLAHPSYADDSSADPAKLTFIDSRLVQYGDIKEGDVASVDIRFRNDGGEPLEITGCFRTCNCTEVEYPQKPLKSGEEGVIHLSVDTAGKYGAQTIVVRLKTNTPQGYSIVRVDMNVIKK